MEGKEEIGGSREGDWREQGGRLEGAGREIGGSREGDWREQDQSLHGNSPHVKASRCTPVYNTPAIVVI